MSRPDWTVTRTRSPWTLFTRDELQDLSRAVSPTAVLVWLMLDTYADRDGKGAFPMQATVAAALGMSVRTVNRAVGDLARAGLLSRRWEVRRGRRMRVYELHHTDAVAPAGQGQQMR